MARLASRGACFALALALVACGGGESDNAAPSRGALTAGNAKPSGNGACGLLMQSEVDELFGTDVGAGADETLDGDVQICSWPSGDEPSLLLQVSPGSSEIRAAVDLGDGYRVVDIAEMSGPAAAAFEDAESDGPEAVVVFAIAAGDKTVTVSPIGLGIAAASPQFEDLKALLDRIASRI